MNSAHFVESISMLKIDSNDHFISFDVKSILTHVLMKMNLYASPFEGTSMTPEQVSSLTELCLKYTYFRHAGQVYGQSDSTAMGSPVSLWW